MTNITTQCTLTDCNKPHYAFGLCNKHYQRFRDKGNPTYINITVHYKKRRNKIVVNRYCKIDRCANPAKYLRIGYCEKHYARWYMHGDPNYLSRVVGENRHKHPLYKAYHAMLDRCYNPNNTHYSYYGGRGITVDDNWRGPHGFSQFINDMGSRPKWGSIDRIDNDMGYNKGNCRWASKSTQQSNQRIPNTNSSGYKGVHKYKATGRWQAYIGVKGKRKHLGFYGTKAEAIEARAKAEVKLKEEKHG